MSRVVLITGAGSGFGRCMVDAFLARGWHVIATMRRLRERTAEFASAAALHGERLELVELDVTSEKQRGALALRLAGRGLDLLVNNAGFGVFGAVENLTEAELRTQIEVNFFAPTFLLQALLPLLRQRRGRILNISSVFGFCGWPLTGAYVASKFALEGLTESLALEMAPHGVQVGLVEPGGFATRFGANLHWSAPEGADPYGAQLAAYRRFHGRLKARGGARPETVARLVVRLAEARRLPLRTRVGHDARLGWLVRRLLPSRLYEPLYAAIATRTQRGSSLHVVPDVVAVAPAAKIVP